MTYTDPTGHNPLFLLFGSFFFGGFLGGAIDAGIQMFVQGKSISELDTESIKVSFFEGGISAGLALFTGGGSLAAMLGRQSLRIAGKQTLGQIAKRTALIHGTVGFGINAVSQKIVKGEVNWGEALTSGVIDAATGGLGSVLPHTAFGQVLQSAGNKISIGAKQAFQNSYDSVRRLIGNNTGSASLGLLVPGIKGIDGVGNGARFAKRPITQSDVIGTLDEGFAGLSSTKKVDAAFKEIENAFGKSYANKIKALYNSTSRSFMKSSDTLGEFKLDVRGKPIIEINKNIGNAKVMANTILHEVRHLRHYNKLGSSPKLWNSLSDKLAEIFATSTNLWQGRKMGLSPDDLWLFENYYESWRTIK